jgi:hypothetical protein
MTKQKTHDIATKQALIAEILRRQDERPSDDLFVNGKPLTLERRRELGWPETLEEAMARMDENKRKQEESKQ